MRPERLVSSPTITRSNRRCVELEAAVIGIADPHWGEVVAAHLVRSADSLLTEEEVKRYCSQRLQGFMVPRVVKFTPELPKTASGKILKRALPR